MEILSLLPMLVKALPVVLLAVFYLLFKRERAKRQTAEQQRDSAQASYEVAVESEKIEEEGDKVVEKIQEADLGGLADMFHSGVRRDADKG